MSKIFALLGSWTWHESQEQTGITVCEYQKNGKLIPLQNYYPQVKVGSPVIISDSSHIYFVHESKHTDDKRHEGGYVYSAKLTENQIIPVNRKKTYSPNPCYCVLDDKQEYLIVVHHASTRSVATKMYRNEEGKVENKIIFDDAAVDLFKLNNDGSIGEIIDYDYHEAEGDKMSLLHGIYKLPDSEIFIVTDKGLDKLYSYKINYELNKLELVDTLSLYDCCRPKYIAILPNEKLIYICLEKRLSIAISKYDNLNGTLQLLKECPLQIKNLNICGTQSLLISSDNKRMYANVMGEDPIERAKDKNNGLYHIINTVSYIATYDISDPYNPVLLQCIPTEGKGARNFAMTPDDKFILVFNTDSNEITRFAIEENGLLKFEEKMNISHPENIVFYTL